MERKTVTLRVEQKLWNELHEIKRKEGVQVTFQVTKAIEMWVKAYKASKRS